MLQCPYPIRLTPIGGKTMRQFSERFCSCRTQQEYTQVGIRIFRFFRTEGSNRFLNRRRIPTCEARHGNPIDFPMLQWEFEEKPRPHYNRPQSWCVCGFPLLRFVGKDRIRIIHLCFILFLINTSWFYRVLTSGFRATGIVIITILDTLLWRFWRKIFHIHQTWHSFWPQKEWNVLTSNETERYNTFEI